MKRIVSIIFAAALLVLAGCNTMNGIGQDLQRAGDSISGASKK